MEVVAFILLIVFSVVGFGAIFFTTFGTFLILIGAVLFALMTQFSILTIPWLIVLLILYLVGELVEYIAIIIGTKKWGASNAAVVGALVGGILGAVLLSVFLGVGVVLGTFLGIFLGAFICEWYFQRDFIHSVKVGVGGVLGRVGSIIAKTILALMMLGCILFQLAKHWG